MAPSLRKPCPNGLLISAATRACAQRAARVNCNIRAGPDLTCSLHDRSPPSFHFGFWRAHARASRRKPIIQKQHPDKPNLHMPIWKR